MDDGCFYRTSDMVPPNRLNQPFYLANSANPNAAEIYQQNFGCLISATGSKESSTFHSSLNFPTNPAAFADLTDLFSLASGRNPSEFPPLPSSANPQVSTCQSSDTNTPPPLTSMPPPPQFLAGRQFHVISNSQGVPVCVPQAYLVASPKPMGQSDPIRSAMYQRRHVGLNNNGSSAFSNSKSGSSVLSGDGGSSSLSSGASGTGETAFDNDSLRSCEQPTQQFTGSDGTSSSGTSPVGPMRNSRGRPHSAGRHGRGGYSSQSQMSGDLRSNRYNQSAYGGGQFPAKRSSQDSLPPFIEGPEEFRNSEHRDGVFQSRSLGRQSGSEMLAAFSKRHDYSNGDPSTLPCTSRLIFNSSQNGSQNCGVNPALTAPSPIDRVSSSSTTSTVKNVNLNEFESTNVGSNGDSPPSDHRNHPGVGHMMSLLLPDFSSRPPPSRDDSVSTSTLNTSSGSADSEGFRPIHLRSLQMGFTPDQQMRTVMESAETDQQLIQQFSSAFGLNPATLNCCSFDGRGPSIPDVHPTALSGGYFADQIYRPPLPFPVSMAEGPPDPSAPHHRYTPSPFRDPVETDGSVEGKPDGNGTTPVSNQSSPSGHQHAVYVHVNIGETLSVRVGNEIQHIPGPATVRMVSQNSGLPAPLPLHVPPGHLVQQILDSTGALRHLILSPQQPHLLSGAFRHPMAGSQIGSPMGPSLNFMAGGAAPMQANFPPVPLSSASHSLPFGPFPPIMTNFPQPPNAQLQAIRFAGMTSGSPPAVGFGHDFQSVSSNMAAVTSSYYMTEGAGQDMSDNPGINDSSENPGEEQAKLIDLLSKIQPPSISEVGGRDALVSWFRIDNSDASCGPFPEIEASDFIYEVLVAERNAAGKYKIYFRGTSTEHRITDLKPATDYHVKLRAIVEPCIGTATEPVEFRTKPCRPDKPDSVRFEKKSKTCITLKWTSAKDNGSRISSYHLEFDQGHGTFVEVFRGSEKYCRVTKLSPGTTYKFRLAASNDLGKSDFSDVFVATTAGNAPLAPEPPQLVESDPYSLHLAWEKRPSDEDFVLQMRDSDPKYGFITRCNGRVLSYICSELRHSQDYFFRLAASNDDGCSPWSEVVVYRTKPARPGCPGKPYLKGKVHSTSAKVAWELPHDDGGSVVSSFLLEFCLVGSTEGWAVMYAGADREYNAHGLLPGRTYHFRVSCASEGGHSGYSDVMTVTTLPIVPGPPLSVALQSKPKPNVIQLKWSPPEFDGGADLSAYEVRMVSPDGNTQLLAANLRLTCSVANLLPGRVYSFCVRAHNRTGAGHWSEPFSCSTGAGAPECPTDVRCTPRSPFSVLVTWAESQHNGAPVTEYRLLQATRKELSSTSDTDQSDIVPTSSSTQLEYEPLRTASSDSSVAAVDNLFDVDLTDFIQIFAGSQCQFEARNLSPASAYAFKVQAVNTAGVSQFCPVCLCRTPPASPAAVINAQAEAIGISEISVSWEKPLDNGSPIVGYQLDVSPLSLLPNPIELPQSSTQYILRGLDPQTVYRIRVLAVNDVGPGVWSSPARATTFSLPPSPPVLELSAFSHNSLKLKWTDVASTREALVYSLEMENKNGSFSPVFEGQGRMHKVPRLCESAQYRFRIRATSPTGGVGIWSDPITYATSRAPPPAPKYILKTTEVSLSSWQVEWQSTKVNLPSGDKLAYVVQLLNTRAPGEDYKEVYRGCDTSCVLSDLSSGSNYRCRYALVRSWMNADGAGGEIVGPFSPIGTFSTSKKLEEREEGQLEPEVKTELPPTWLFPNPLSVLRGDAELSERQCAFLFVACLSVAALLVAFLIQWLIS